MKSSTAWLKACVPRWPPVLRSAVRSNPSPRCWRVSGRSSARDTRGRLERDPAAHGVSQDAWFRKIKDSTAFSFANTRVDVSSPSIYDETNSVSVLSPAMGVALPSKGSWRFGFALYGSVGNKFDFGADPSEGVPDDFMAGHTFRGSRDIGADEVLILPGRYSIDGQIAMIGISWRH